MFSKDLPLAIGSDHAGFEYKKEIIEVLEKEGWMIQDFGAFSEDRFDYPDAAHPVAQMVSDGKARFGIVICGSGNGVNITANKHAGVRSALCWMPEIAALARQHNDANILALPARFISLPVALACVTSFIQNDFEGGRHSVRVAKIE